ncbi:MAG TPA: ABC transporter ATP-binding protein [Verrucomicrobiae bacterium]|jgi:subfamily B ATP-binding cassette protein MsbA|nr:ABC transporter ATP-binding protein [Verrucomicrobiae bacterium]
MIEFWLKLWQLARPYKARFIVGIIMGVLSGLMETLVLVTAAFVVGTIFFHPEDVDIQKITAHLPGWLAGLKGVILSLQNSVMSIQRALAGQVAGSKAGLILLVSLIPVMMLLRGVVNYLNSYLMNWVAIRAVCDLRARLFDQLQNQPLSFLSRLSTPELMSRIGDASVLQNMIAVSMVTIIREPVTGLTLFAAPFLIDWKLTLATFVVLPLCAFPVIIYNRKVRQAGAANQTEAMALNKVMHEAFTGNRIIKAYNLESVMTERYAVTLRKFIGHYMRVVRATETPGPIIEFVGSIGVAALLVYLASANKAPASIAIFVVALLSMYKPIKATIRVQSQLHQARAATQRLFELLATPNGMPDVPHPQPVQAAGAEIHFDDVSFGYDQKIVLRNIQLRVQPGQMVAIVGGTGGGKTTLTNLLLRFYDPTSGVIRIGGVDIRQAALRQLRAQIAVVTQDVILFNDTIANNIGYGRPGATRAEIEDAARHAFAHDFILEKPRGYDAVVGERGANLSGGQRQRLAIARAILRDAPILILDEATSSLDNESERIVQAALDELMKGRTTICIAHRLSTVRNADVIVAIERGEIMEMGRHDELLQHDGVYHKLYSLSVATGRNALQFPEPPVPRAA